MEWLDFGGRPLAFNLAVFAGSAAVVWFAGARVARHADRFANLTGIAHGTVGLVMLAAITSLPEVAVSLTAAAAGSPSLAVNSLLGALAMQVALLAVADAALGKDALTVVAGTSAVLLQVTMDILLLLMVAAILVVGDIPFAGAGVGSWGLLAAYGFAVWTISRAQGRQVWVTRPADRHPAPGLETRARDGDGALPQHPGTRARQQPDSLRALLPRMAAAAAAILVAGVLISRTGEAVAEQTGLGASFVGVVLLAFSSSLPEVSAVLSAMKLGRYQMAIGDIFGTGLFNIALLAGADMVYRGPPLLNEVGRFSLVASLLAALMACIYLAGLLERHNRTIARMGVDSFAVLALYAAGLVVLYSLR